MSPKLSALEGAGRHEPTERGFEKEIKRRLDGWEEIKRSARLDRPRTRGLTDRVHSPGAAGLIVDDVMLSRDARDVRLPIARVQRVWRQRARRISVPRPA
jgi:hypothetical protein